MKFKFSLQPVLNVREHREKIQKQKLAEKIRIQQDISEQRTKIAAGLEEFLSQKDSHRVYDIHKLRNSYAHLEQTHQVMEKLDRDIEKAEVAVKNERNKLVKAHRDTHILEKAKEREHHSYMKEESRKERIRMDEIAAQFFGR